MIIIEEKSNNLIKATAENEPYIYEVGDTIYKQRYIKSELRFVRVPTYKVIKVRKIKSGQRLILSVYPQ